MLVLNDTKYYLYVYGCPDTGKIFYVGKGSNGRHRQAIQRSWDIRRGIIPF